MESIFDSSSKYFGKTASSDWMEGYTGALSNLASLFSTPSVSDTWRTAQNITNQVNDYFNKVSPVNTGSIGSVASTTASSNAATLMSAFPQLLDTVKATGEEIDAYLQKYAYDTLDKFAPGWQDMMSATTNAATNVANFASQFVSELYPTMANNLMSLGDQATAQASTLLQGQLPGDVLSMVRQGSAERAVSGLGASGSMSTGTAARNLTMRDLGLNSLNAMTLGSTMAGTASSLYGQVGSLGTATGQMLGSPATYGATGAQAISALVPDSTSNQWLGAAGNLASVLGSTSLTDPNQLASLYAELAKYNTELEWTKAVSAANQLTGASSMVQGQQFGSGLFGGLS